MPTRGSLRVVFDASALIVLVKLGVLREALSLFNEIEVPSGVLEEIARRINEVYQELTRVIDEGRIRVEDVKRKLPRLGTGESSAIILALTRGKVVVLDDKRARKLARELGLEVIGTLSILKRLHESGILTETPNVIYRRLIEIGFYVDKRLFDRVFKER